MSKRIPALTAREVINVLKRVGFYERRQTGSHIILRKEGLLRPVPIPDILEICLDLYCWTLSKKPD